MSGLSDKDEGPFRSIEIVRGKRDFVIYGKRTYIYNKRGGFFLQKNVRLGNKFVKKGFYLHRELWKDFYGQEIKGLCIFHIDGDKKNNLLSNLVLSNSDIGKQILRNRRSRDPLDPPKIPQVCVECESKFFSKNYRKKFCCIFCTNKYYRTKNRNN